MQLKVNDLYQLQNGLDEEIYQKFSLTREGTSIRRRLALLVELGECVNETRCFKSVGMGLFDVRTAQLIYEKALEKGIGQKLNF